MNLKLLGHASGFTEMRGAEVARATTSARDGALYYVHATIGDVAAGTTYGARESFNHPLIMAAALLAVATVFSGTMLWGLREYRRARGARGRARRPKDDGPVAAAT